MLPFLHELSFAREASRKLFLWIKNQKCQHLYLFVDFCVFAEIPFICFNLVNRRSKLSTSASPAVRVASSWISKSVIASEQPNRREWFCFFCQTFWKYVCSLTVLAVLLEMIIRTQSVVNLPTKAFACVAMFVLLSVFSFSSLVTEPPTGRLEDCRPKKGFTYTQHKRNLSHKNGHWPQDPDSCVDCCVWRQPNYSSVRNFDCALTMT